MTNLKKFAYAGMISCSTPSPNRVGYFSPTTLHSEIEAGAVSIQSTVVLGTGSCLCTNNEGIAIGDVNPNTGHIHPGRVTVEKDAWIGHIGDKGGNILTIGKCADGVLIINSGKGLFGKGDIVNPSAHIATVKVNEGMLLAHHIRMENPLSSLTIRNGIVRTEAVAGRFTTWVFSGLYTIGSTAKAGEIRLTGRGSLLFGISSHKLSAADMGHAGVNFIGDGGALIVRLDDTGASLSQTYEAEAFFDALLKEGKLKRDDQPVKDFAGFKMAKVIGHDNHCYAVLRPMQEGSIRKLMPDALKKFFYGDTKQTYGL